MLQNCALAGLNMVTMGWLPVPMEIFCNERAEKLVNKGVVTPSLGLMWTVRCELTKGPKQTRVRPEQLWR